MTKGNAVIKHETTIESGPTGMLPSHPQLHYWWRCSCGADSLPHHPIYQITDRSEVEMDALHHVEHGPGVPDASKGRAAAREKGWRM